MTVDRTEIRASLASLTMYKNRNLLVRAADGCGRSIDALVRNLRRVLAHTTVQIHRDDVRDVIRHEAIGIETIDILLRLVVRAHNRAIQIRIEHAEQIRGKTGRDLAELRQELIPEDGL